MMRRKQAYNNNGGVFGFIVPKPQPLPTLDEVKQKWQWRESVGEANINESFVMLQEDNNQA